MNRHVIILLGLCLMSRLNAPGQGAFRVNGEAVLPAPAPPVSRAPLRMASLAGEALTGTNLPGCVGGSWRHRGAVAAPLMAVAVWDATTVQSLQNLRAALAALDQMVQLETADRIYTDMPVIRGPGGLSRDNIVRRSPRDVQAAGERAANSAANTLARFIRAPGRRPVAVRANGTFISIALEPGTYVLCGIIRYHDDSRRVGASQKLAVWWTPFALAPDMQIRYALDEANTIGWARIFE